MNSLFTVIVAFLVWNFLVYGYHRIAHMRFAGNIFYHIHLAHHREPYTLHSTHNIPQRWFYPSYFLLWYGSFKESLDMWLGQFMPALFVGLLFGGSAWLVLVYVYVYEAFLGDLLFDHNPHIKHRGIFSGGQFHLEHHRNPKVNFSFSITLFDWLFGSYSSKKKLDSE